MVFILNILLAIFSIIPYKFLLYQFAFTQLLLLFYQYVSYILLQITIFSLTVIHSCEGLQLPETGNQQTHTMDCL